MKLVTFNIRYANPTDSGEFAQSARLEHITRKLLSERPALVGFQEIQPGTMNALRAALKGYELFGEGRCEGKDNEATPLCYDASVLRLLNGRTFWLSNHPDVKGSKFPGQGSLPRVCTYGEFEDIQSGRRFNIYNTHLHHLGARVRLMELKMLTDIILKEQQSAGRECFLTGDFNAQPQSEEIAMLSRLPFLRDITSPIGGTWHDFGRREPAKIDYIYCTGGVEAKQVALWDDVPYLSDHYPVAAEVTFR